MEISGGGKLFFSPVGQGKRDAYFRCPDKPH